jgi:hypothetical protein
VTFHRAEATGHPDLGCPHLAPTRNGVGIRTAK